MYTDWMFGYAADTQARTHARENTVYQMVFGYRTDALPDSIPEYTGKSPSDFFFDFISKLSKMFQ